MNEEPHKKFCTRTATSAPYAYELWTPQATTSERSILLMSFSAPARNGVEAAIRGCLVRTPSRAAKWWKQRPRYDDVLHVLALLFCSGLQLVVISR